MQTSESAQAAPVVIAEFPKNKKETMRISFVEFNGHSLLEIRAYYPAADGTMQPGKGVAIQRAQVVTLRKALQQAERAMKEERPAQASANQEESESEE